MAEVAAGPEVAGRWWRLDGLDRQVLGLWLLSRLSMVLLTWSGPRLFAGTDGAPGPLAGWQSWDFAHFDQIARHGYFAPWRAPVEAFFPGLPLLMRGGLAVGVEPVVTGLLVSFLAGAVAVVALGRLAAHEYGRAAALPSVGVFLAAPVAFFLAAPYSEAPFLAFAIPAWLAARREHWLAAGLLTAGACLFRVSALFLLVALAVLFLTSRDLSTPRRWLPTVPVFALPLVPLLAYMAYLHAHTGDWLRWYHAQAEGWYRTFTPPWTALEHTVQAAQGVIGFGADTPKGTVDEYAWMFVSEIVAVAIGLVATVTLFLHRRWGEGTWVGLQVASLSTSYWFFSVPRASLLWWPMWMLLGAWAARRRWVLWVYLALSLPLLGVWTSAFLTYRWAG